MSKCLNLNCKKVLFSIMAATSIVGGIVPATCVKAATNAVATTVKNSNAKIAVKGSIITFDRVVSQKESVAQSNIPIVNADALADVPMLSISIERKEGMPKKMNVVELDMKGEVVIEDQKYNLNFQASSACKKISNTQAKQEYIVVAKDQAGKSVDLKPVQLKGKKVSITINKVKFVEDSYTKEKGEMRKEVAADTEADAKAVEWVF